MSHDVRTPATDPPRRPMVRPHYLTDSTPLACPRESMPTSTRSGSKRGAPEPNDASSVEGGTDKGKRRKTAKMRSSGDAASGNANPTARDLVSAARRKSRDELSRLGNSKGLRRASSSSRACNAASPQDVIGVPPAAPPPVPVTPVTTGAASADAVGASSATTAAPVSTAATLPEPPHDPRTNKNVYAPKNMTDANRSDNPELRKKKMEGAGGMKRSKRSSSKLPQNGLSCFNSDARTALKYAIKNVAGLLKHVSIDPESKYFEADNGTVKVALVVYSDAMIHNKKMKQDVDEDARRKIVSRTASGRKPLLFLVSRDVQDAKAIQGCLTTYFRELKEVKKNHGKNASLDHIKSFDIHELWGYDQKENAESFFDEAVDASSRKEYRGSYGITTEALSNAMSRSSSSAESRNENE